MNNIVTLQSNISGMNLTNLSKANQEEVFGLLKEITTIVLNDFISNPNTTVDQVNTLFTSLTTVQVTKTPPLTPIP